MKSLSRLSAIIHFLILCSFFLPFFPIGCDNTSVIAEKAKADSIARTDSIRIADSLSGAVQDTNKAGLQSRKDSVIKNVALQAACDSAKDSVAEATKLPTDSFQQMKDSLAILTNELQSYTNYKGSEISGKLAAKGKILQVLLRPGNSYSGVGFILDSFVVYVYSFGVITAFIFLLIAFMMKCRRTVTNRWMLWFLSVLSILGLYFGSFQAFANPLWGHLVCILMVLVLSLFDLLLALIWREKRSY